MRMLLYNIRYAAGIGTSFHLPLPYAGYLKRSSDNLENIVSFIKSIEPDIIGLIEVDSGSYRTENMCQAEIIADRLGYSCVFESKYGEGSFVKRMPVIKKQGNGILTNRKIQYYKFHYFKEGVKRLVIEVQLDELTIFLVHLSLTFRKRQYQLERLYRLVKGTAGAVIVAGDFNVLWGERELQLFLAASGLTSANNNSIPSHPSRSPRRQLDFILHSPEVSVSDFFIPPVKHSDHAPLVCNFTLQ